MRGPGVFYDRHRCEWMYQPEAFTAEDCEQVAGMMGRDGWAQDLLEAAEVIRAREAEEEQIAADRARLAVVVREGPRGG